MTKIINALGIQGQLVSDIKINIPIDNFVTVDLRLLLRDEQADEIETIFKQYMLVERVEPVEKSGGTEK